MISKLLTVAAAVAISSTAYATTVDFDDMVNEDSFIVQSTYSFQGYDFVGTPDDNLVFFGEAVRNLHFNADPNGTTLTTNFPGATSGFTVSRTDGAVFDLATFQYTDTFDDGVSTNDVFLDLSFADSTKTRQLFHPDGHVGLQTFFANALGLKSFTIETPQTAQFDNFVMDNATGAVPEPATWAMMLSGFGIVGASIRTERRRASL